MSEVRIRDRIQIHEFISQQMGDQEDCAPKRSIQPEVQGAQKKRKSKKWLATWAMQWFGRRKARQLSRFIFPYSHFLDFDVGGRVVIMISYAKVI